MTLRPLAELEKKFARSRADHVAVVHGGVVRATETPAGQPALVIGGGSGGVRAARVASATGAKVALAEDDTMIGSITLDYDRGELELSYALLPEWTGLGYAAESCIALLDWARRELADEVVIAISQTRNKRSVALLRKLGFTVRKGLEEFGTQQLLLERSLRIGDMVKGGLWLNLIGIVLVDDAVVGVENILRRLTATFSLDAEAHS